MREAGKLDRTAPRFRPARTSLVTPEFYRRFRSKFPQYKDYPDSKLREILDTLHGLMYSHAIESRDGVELFEGLGFIFIGTCPKPTRKSNIDYDLSLKLGQQVRHRNFESDNFLAKIFYTNFGKYKFQNREAWSFTGCRSFKNAVSATYPIKWKQYLQVDNFTRVSRIFRKSNSRLWAIQNPLEVPADYNEFKL